MTKKQPVEKSVDQFDRFVGAAKSLECDESEKRFDEALKKVARHKPKEELDKANEPDKPESD